MFEYLKTVKFVILFKSADLILDIYRHSTRISNFLLATELLDNFLKAFRKKEFIYEYLKDSIFQLIACVYIMAHQFNILSSESNIQVTDLLPSAANKKKV